MITRILLAALMALACPGVVSADYLVKSCNSQGCTTRVVRTPVRNVVGWSSPAQYTDIGRSSGAVVKTYRRGLFGRRVHTGYTTVSTAPQASYGSSGSYQSYSQPVVTYSQPTVSYGSSGATTTYREVPTSQSAETTTTQATVTAPEDCDCNGECGCPCCPCRPKSTKPDYSKQLQIGKTLRIPKYQLATKKLTIPDLRLASR